MNDNKETNQELVIKNKPNKTTMSSKKTTDATVKKPSKPKKKPKAKAKKKTTAKQTLTVKQKAFVIEFIKNQGNATQAAIKAGYSKNSAAVIGIENLRKPNIQEELQKRTAEKKEKAVAQADEILELLTMFARGNAEEEQIVIEGIGQHYSKARIMKKKTANRDQLNALDKLARIHGLYNDRVEITQADRERSDVHQKTLEALKGGRVIEGFNNDEEIEDSLDD